MLSEADDHQYSILLVGGKFSNVTTAAVAHDPSLLQQYSSFSPSSVLLLFLLHYLRVCILSSCR